jgi:tRNA G18 (ribose-2'-O)-methylase SpoU
MPICPIESPDDPCLNHYRNMKDKELARDGGRFIAEGEHVVRRLLASRFRVESVLIARRKLEAIAPLANPQTPVYCAEDDIIERIIGFEFHSGVLACGIRPTSPALAEIVPPRGQSGLIVAAQQITNTENLGALIRIAAAFGASGMLLGESCCDPFFRQSVRVSMGTIFRLPIVRSENLCADLDRLGTEEFETWAAVLDGDAETLSRMPPPQRAAIVFGNEAQGLDPQTVAHCQKHVVIPMHLGTDSLNVAVAAAVFLYHMTRESGAESKR